MALVLWKDNSGRVYRKELEAGRPVRRTLEKNTVRLYLRQYGRCE